MTPVKPVPDTQVTVFLVDDNEAVLLSIQTLLEVRGYTVCPALGHEQVMALMEAGHRPDVLITDFRLPKVSGIEIIKQVRVLMGEVLPAIIMSGDTTVREIREADLARCAVLQKPSRSETIFRLIDEVIASQAE